MNTYIKIESEDFVELSLSNYQNFEKQRYKNKFRKVIFFLLNEGLRQTLRKILSVQSQRKIMSAQKVIACQFVLNDSNNIRYVGIGRQLRKGKSKKFHPKLVFKICNKCKFNLSEFKLDRSTSLEISSFLPVDECPFDNDLPSLMVSQNPRLELADVVFKENYTWKPEKNINKNSKQVFIYGFGSYSCTYVMKHFNNNINSVIDYNRDTLSSFNKAHKVSFFEDFRDSLSLYSKIEKPIAIISTYHSSHFKITKELFYANANGKILIEKPLVVKFSDALELISLRKKGLWFDAGYNRRYIDWNRYIKSILINTRSPKIINMSIKEVLIPRSHWYYWSNQGTRVTGNLCHWIDLSYFWLKCKPCEMSLLSSNDSVSLSILFEDDSLVNIIASDQGNNLRGVQERIEVRTEDKTIFIDDYKKMIIYNNGRAFIKRKLLRDKGHGQMYKEFLNATKTGRKALYENDDVFWVSYLAEKASQMFIDEEKYAKIDVDYEGENSNLFK